MRFAFLALPRASIAVGLPFGFAPFRLSSSYVRAALSLSVAFEEITVTGEYDIMKFAKLAILATGLAVTPIAANAQDVGTTVYGNDEAAIGTVDANDGTTVTVNTGKHMAPLPANLLAEREGKWTVNATKAQIDGMMDQQVAAAETALAEALTDGAHVMSADAQHVGTILAIGADVDQYLISTGSGVITLKREHFSVDGNGTLLALFSGEQLADFTIAVPEGAIVETPVGKMTRTADGWEAMEVEAEAGDDA